MREVGRYYWAKMCQDTDEEIIYCYCHGIQSSEDKFTRFSNGHHYIASYFYWISDTPIEKPKVQYEDKKYYVFDPQRKYTIGTNNTFHFGKMVGQYQKQMNAFFAEGCYFYPEYYDIKIISGPFTIEELINLKPVSNI